MHIFLLAGLLMTGIVHAGVGKVLKISGADAHIIRENKKLPLTKNMVIELNDEINSSNALVLIGLDPVSQVSMDSNSRLKVSEHSKEYMVVDLLEGTIRSLISSDKKVQFEYQVRSEGAAASGNNGEFEMSVDKNKDVKIFVFKKQVAVSSPYIQSFVPEIVKAKEGLKFEMSKKSFSKTNVEPGFKNHPGFKKSKKKK